MHVFRIFLYVPPTSINVALTSDFVATSPRRFSLRPRRKRHCYMGPTENVLSTLMYVLLNGEVTLYLQALIKGYPWNGIKAHCVIDLGKSRLSTGHVHYAPSRNHRKFNNISLKMLRILLMHCTPKFNYNIIIQFNNTIVWSIHKPQTTYFRWIIFLSSFLLNIFILYS